MPNEKTSVTNPPVTESGNTQQNNPSGEGQIPSDVESKVRENLRGEYERKSMELSEKLDEANERIAELDSEVRLTKAEIAERSKLEKTRSGIESQIDALETQEDAKPWLGAIDKRVERSQQTTIEQAKNEMSKEMMEDWLEEKALEENVKPEALRKEVLPYAGKYMDKLPHTRVKLAFRDLANARKSKEKDEEYKKWKAERDSQIEGGDRAPRDLTPSEAREKGDTQAEMKSLGL